MCVVCESYMLRLRSLKRPDSRFRYVFILFFVAIAEYTPLQATARCCTSPKVLESALAGVPETSRVM